MNKGIIDQIMMNKDLMFLLKIFFVVLILYIILRIYARKKKGEEKVKKTEVKKIDSNNKPKKN